MSPTLLRALAVDHQTVTVPPSPLLLHALAEDITVLVTQTQVRLVRYDIQVFNSYKFSNDYYNLHFLFSLDFHGCCGGGPLKLIATDAEDDEMKLYQVFLHL